MKLLNTLVIALSALMAAPAAAQGPVAPEAAAPASLEAGTAEPAPSEAPNSSAEDASPASASTLDPVDLEAWLDGFLSYALDNGQIAGAVVAVVEDGEVLLEKGYGYADVASRKPVDPDTTLFRPGSVSKLFTWTAVMQQVEAGNLDLDADVNTYLDFEIPPYEGEPLTLRDIMTHTPGFEESIRHLISDDPEAVMPLGEYAREALPARVFAPGTTPAYSNYATALAGYTVERVSGMPFEDYIEQRIFEPLEMENSTFRQPLPERLEDQMSSGYPTVGEEAKPFEIVIPGPAGSLSSTGTDMAKFMIAHLNEGGPLLSPQTARQMHDFRAPGTGPLNRMALGFYEQWSNGHRAIGHGGDTGWFHSYLWLFPDSDIGLFISVNSGGKAGAAQAIRSGLFDEFTDRYLPGEANYQPIDEDTALRHAQMMAGTYVMSRGSFTNFLSLFGLMSGGTKVVVGPDGQLMIPSLDGLSAGVRDWVEVEPFVWVDRNTGERMAADVEDGRVVRFSIDTFSPFTVLEPAPFGTNPAWLIPALIAALAIAALAAFAWPIRALVRRHYKSQFILRDSALRTYRLTRVFAWLVLLAVAGWIALVAIFSSDIGAIGGPLDWLITLLRILTPVASIGLLVMAAWHLWNCLRDRRRWTMKLGAVLLVFAGLVLTWVTIAFNLYGFGMVY